MKRYIIKYMDNHTYESNSAREVLETFKYALTLDRNAEIYEAHYLRIKPEELEAKI